MEEKKLSLIDVIEPQPNSVVMICDVHASESGALSILDDLYWQIKNNADKSVRWVFIVSVPQYEQTENIIIRRFPWVKQNWVYRFFFDIINMRQLVSEYCPDQIFSLQNKGISFYNNTQKVYLHFPAIFSTHRFSIIEDGKRLWFYQNIFSKVIFRSLKKVDTVIVQTQWMKDALVKKTNIEVEKIKIIPPDITNNQIGKFHDIPENRKIIFYPATAISYKNHMTLLKAVSYAVDCGLEDYQVVLTIRPEENRYTKQLFSYACEKKLKVDFKGQLSRNKVFDMYTKSVLAFPSYLESYGLPLLEARNTGTYILASDCPFSREILDGYDKVLFFSEMDYEQLGRHILSLNKRLLESER